MAQHKVSGDDMLIFIGTDGLNYETVICLTSQSITRTTTEIDAKTKCGPDKLPGTQENTIAFEGQSMYDPDATFTSIDQLVDYWMYKTNIFFKYGKAEPAEGDVVYFGEGFISQMNEDSAMDAPTTFSGAIGVSGLIQKTTATS